jgi:hypothetical protein
VGALAALVLASSGLAALAAGAGEPPDVAATPSASASVSGTPSAVPSRPAGPPAGGSPKTGTTSGTPGRPPASPTSCVPSLNANVTNTSVPIEVRLSYPKPRCPNERLRVFWASYTLDAAGVQHLYRSGTTFLDLSRQSVRLTPVLPTDCLARNLYVAQGSAAIPGTITTGTDLTTADPFRVPPPGVGNSLFESGRAACPNPSPSG